MPPIPLVGPSSTVRSWSLDKARCVNMFPEVAESPKGKSIAALYGTPGLRLFATLPSVGGCRGLHTTWDGRVFAVQGDNVYEIQADGVVFHWATLVPSSGPVSMADSFTQLMIVGQPFAASLSLSTNETTYVSDADFPGATHVVFLDGYFVFNRPNTGQFFISGLNNGLTYDALDFATAEGNPDRLYTIIADHRELWLFGSATTEVFFNSGNADFPFERFQGAYIEQGIALNAVWTVCKLDNSVFWVGENQDGAHIVWRADGYQPRRISTHSVELNLKAVPRDATMTAFAYQDEGHSFYQINLVDTSWVYDVATGLWHERCYHSPVTGQFTRHRAQWHTFGHGKHLVGDYQDGRIYELDMDYFRDDTDALISERIFPYITGDGLRLRHHGLEVECEAGIGLDGGVEPGTTPQMMLQWSDTDGKTWSNEHWQSMGRLGKYATRVNWSRLGQAWNRLYKLRISDPVKRAIVTAYLDVSGGRS